MLHLVGEYIDFTQYKEKGVSTGNKEEDKHTEELHKAVGGAEGIPLLTHSSMNFEIAPDGRMGNVFETGED